MVDRAQLEQVLDGLAEVYHPEGILIWLRAPNLQFAGRSALQLLDDGDGERVLEVIGQLTSGSFA